MKVGVVSNFVWWDAGLGGIGGHRSFLPSLAFQAGPRAPSCLPEATRRVIHLYVAYDLVLRHDRNKRKER